MNKVRRQDLAEIFDTLDEAISQLGDVRDEEQEALDNLPESFQESPRGEAMQEAIDAMDAVESAIEDVKAMIQDIIDA